MLQSLILNLIHITHKIALKLLKDDQLWITIINDILDALGYEATLTISQEEEDE